MEATVSDEALDEMAALVGRHVKRARRALGLTLDQLAEASGVSRRMIVNIEAGSTHASLATLLRLTRPLQTTLGALVEEPATSLSLPVSVARRRQPLWRGEHGGSATLVASAATPDMLELWEWILQPGEVYGSDPHPVGTYELFHVHSGRLTITVADAEALLRSGDSTAFEAHEPHSYANYGRAATRFSTTVFEPTRRSRRPGR